MIAHLKRRREQNVALPKLTAKTMRALVRVTGKTCSRSGAATSGSPKTSQDQYHYIDTWTNCLREGRAHPGQRKHHFPLVSSSWSTTEGSARVDVSPISDSCLLAIFLRIRRMIFPERVLGTPAPGKALHCVHVHYSSMIRYQEEMTTGTKTEHAHMYTTSI